MSDTSPISIFWRDLQLIELDCGRQQGWNSVFSSAITVYRIFDSSVGQFRPLAVPVTQILDPFNEVTFHSNQVRQEVIEPRPLQLTNLL